MKKIISFSLWGDNPKYTYGAIKNAELAQTVYPGWICRFYIGKSVPVEIIERLKNYENVELIDMQENGDWDSMFWRFYAISDDDVEIMISRDCDSRLSHREKECVDEFIKSNKLFHTMIDHVFHNGIMGGMWGAKKGIVDNMKSLIDNYTNKTNQWQTDQSFLNKIISPIVSNNILIHDSINLKNFPSSRINYHYVGEIFDHEDNRFEQYVLLMNNPNIQN